MRKFKWRLDRVLDVKKQQKQKVKLQLIELAQQLAQARADLLSQQEILSRLLRQVAALPAGRRVAQQRLFLESCGQTDADIERLKGYIEQLIARQSQMQQEFKQLHRDCKAMEKLREKARNQWLEEQKLTEQKQLDEAVTTSFARKVLDGQRA